MTDSDKIKSFSQATLKAMEQYELEYNEKISIGISILGSLMANALREVQESGYKSETIEHIIMSKILSFRIALDEMVSVVTECHFDIEVVSRKIEYDE
jgi:hypothetical protein